MPKRPNLAEITAAAGSTRRLPPASDPPQEQPVLVGNEGQRRMAVPKPKTRRGTKQVAAHFPEDAAWQLRELSVEQRTTVQDLLGEALNDLFQKYGKPELLPSRHKSRA
jgi:hypothetical protein